jgi:signal peptidase I
MMTSASFTASLARRTLATLTLVSWVYLCALLGLWAWVAGSWVAFRWEPVVITSSSMAPQLRPGDVVMTGRPGPDRLGPGVVVTFTSSDGAGVTHRIHRANRDGSYQTKGDTNADPDAELLQPAAVAGVGRLIVPAIGRPFLWWQEGQLGAFATWAAFTGAAAVLALSPAIRRRSRHPAAAPAPPPSAGLELAA